MIIDLPLQIYDVQTLLSYKHEHIQAILELINTDVLYIATQCIFLQLIVDLLNFRSLIAKQLGFLRMKNLLEVSCLQDPKLESSSCFTS